MLLPMKSEHLGWKLLPEAKRKKSKCLCLRCVLKVNEFCFFLFSLNVDLAFCVEFPVSILADVLYVCCDVFGCVL